MNLGKKLTFLLGAVVFLLMFGSQSWFVPGNVPEALASKPKSDVDYWLKELSSRKPKPLKVASVRKSDTKIIATSGASTKKNTMVARGEETAKGPKKISVDFYKVDLHNVFRLLGQVSGKNVVVDEGVKGTLTLALDDVPWTFVLEVIKNLKGLESIERNNTIMIYPQKKSIQWAGEASNAGTLETVPAGTVEVTKRKKRHLSVEKKLRSTTPLKQIMKAEKLIKKASAQERRGNMIGAYESLKKAAELWPDNLKLLDKLAAIALQRNDNLAAFNYAKRALKLNNKDAEAAAIAAVALARMERPEDAKEYFELAMNIKPTRDTLWNYAVFSFSQGNYRQALRLINRIEANYNITPDMLMLKAQCYEYLSKIPQAIEEYRALLSSGASVSNEMKQFARLRLNALTGVASAQ
ncbi:MAG: hypothetical protein GXO58_01580 [Thermodesulfobacteria bacterium]|nr:hypothetical protein [Thermodesulfobacteriota bacterium]